MLRQKFRVLAPIALAASLYFVPWLTAPAADQAAVDTAATGPLRVSRDNPRYFSDPAGRVVYLTGMHTWNNLVDMGPEDPPPAFDFEAYLDDLVRHHHNFVRLWTWEPVTWNTKGNRQNALHTVAPQPYARTGPGRALDGKPKFDLRRYDPEYFQRLRSRVAAAGRRGIYVSVMLFEGWALQFSPAAWEGHPYHPQNNVNGIDGDRNDDGQGLEIHTLADGGITELQEAYVRKVIDTVNDLDNVLYEISNENHPPSTDWQYHMIRVIKRYQESKPRQHPVGMTFQYKGGSNQVLFDSPADWISPNHEGGYRDNPPAAKGRKVIITDTDHLWGIGGNPTWVWKSFLRGLNPIFMDPYDGTVLGPRDDVKWGSIRRALGATHRVAEAVNLRSMTPHGELSSTNYCLAEPGREYLVYQPEAGQSVTLQLEPGRYRCAGYDTSTGEVRDPKTIRVDHKRHTFPAPDDAEWVLHVVRTQPAN